VSGVRVIDSHCHLADLAFADDLEAVTGRAREAGIAGALCILSADEPEEVQRTESVRAAWPEVAFAAAIHPHRAGAFEGRTPEAAVLTGEVVDAVSAVAVGEIGLDYHYDFSPRAVQRDVFAAQAALATERGLPIVVHTREAFADTLAVLGATPGVRGVLHCFSGTIEEARQALDLGFYLSLAGIVTFPKAGDVRAMARFVPADRLLVETDAPYLAPVPHRGKRNEPAWVVETLHVLASTREVAAPALGEAVCRNFADLIGRHAAGPAR
jgi:TatD DNase family protein